MKKAILAAMAFAAIPMAAIAEPRDTEAERTVAGMDWTIENCQTPLHPAALLAVGALRARATAEGVAEYRPRVDASIMDRFKNIEAACNGMALMWSEVATQAISELKAEQAAAK